MLGFVIWLSDTTAGLKAADLLRARSDTEREDDLRSAQAHWLTRRSNQMKTGGAWARFAGAVHTSYVKTQSRGLAWRFGGFSERASDEACASTSTQKKGIGWNAGLLKTIAFTVGTTAFSVEQHEPSLLSCLWESGE